MDGLSYAVWGGVIFRFMEGRDVFEVPLVSFEFCLRDEFLVGFYWVLRIQRFKFGYGDSFFSLFFSSRFEIWLDVIFDGAHLLSPFKLIFLKFLLRSIFLLIQI